MNVQDLNDQEDQSEPGAMVGHWGLCEESDDGFDDQDIETLTTLRGGASGRE